MSKNQPGHFRPAVGLNSGISSVTQTQNGHFCFSFFFPDCRPPFFPVSLVGVTGFEPVTLRLSSACSNQLSYTPDLRFALTFSVGGGGKGTRTPDL